MAIQLSDFTYTDPCATNSASIYYSVKKFDGSAVPYFMLFDTNTRILHVKSCNNSDAKSYYIKICATMPLYQASNCSSTF